MKQEEKNSNDIIVRYLTGKANREERAQLEQWILACDQNRIQFEQTRNVWEIMNPVFDLATIQVDSALEHVNPRKKKLTKLKKLLIYSQRIAAVLFIPLICALSFVLSSETEKIYTEDIYQEVLAAYGTRVNINLPDGSMVYLNAGGRLKYPKEFKEGERSVYLNGEAYFEVQSDKKNPFIVHTDAMNVKATGTSFNVEGYANCANNAVTLVKGAVQVKLDKKDKVLDLQPGQRVNYDTEKLNYRLEEVDPYKWCSWKDGYLIFRDDSLSEVFKKIGQVYNVEIAIADSELAKYSLRATFSDESLDEILKLIKISTPISYVERSQKAVSDGRFTKRYIEVRKVSDPTD